MRYSPVATKPGDEDDPPPSSGPLTPRWLQPTITAFEVLRSACLAALVGLSVDATLVAKEVPRDVEAAMILLVAKLNEMQKMEMVITVIYAILLLHSLALIFLRAGTRLRTLVSTLLHVGSIAVFALYAYRDIFPLITFDRSPQDPRYVPAALVWARVALLAVSSILVPLFQPRPFVPLADDAEAPASAHPEEIASLASFTFFAFMDSVVLRAWRTTAIPYDDLPPLAGYDRAGYLAKTALVRMHPTRRTELGLPKRHLFVGMLSVFWKTYGVMSLMVLIRACLEFASPIGINRLLTYLQTDGEGAEIKPWFWIIWLFLGPTFSSMAWQFYQFTSTRNLVRVESLFTQMLFEHSLRIKMKDDVEDSTPAVVVDPAVKSGAATPAIVVESTDDATHNTLASSQATVFADGEAESESSSTVKGTATPGPAAPKSDKEASLVGRINTLMSADVDNIVEGRDILMFILYGPVQIALGTVFLYQILSWSSLVGMLAAVVTLPIPGYLAGILNATQKQTMKATDGRIQIITEAINTLRMVKLFAWEEKMKQRIADKRDLELKQIKRKALISVSISSVNWLLPILTMVITYGLYTTVEKKTLTAAKIFSSISVFEMVRHQLYQLTTQLQSFITAKVSLERLNVFLTETELLDGLKDDVPAPVVTTESEQIFFRDATFAWTPKEQGATRFKLHIDDLQIPEGKATLVCGKTSAGKTSLLMALLGEMNWQPRSTQSAFNLPRDKGVAYAAQTAWVMADTVRGNILFGSPYDPDRYRKVLHQCALEKDLELFAAGDQTELGEKGLNASGGQKARISLARAVYSSAQIVLLDDILSALDITTSKWIIEKCFKGDLLRGRTVVLVTHHVGLAAPVADYMVRLALNGTVEYQGPPDKSALTVEDEVVAAEDVAEIKVEGEVPAAKPAEDSNAGKLVVAEEKGEGRVSRRSLLRYFAAAGGPIFWSIYYIDIFAGEILFAYCNWWLGLWSQAYAENPGHPEVVSTTYYMSMYVALMVIQLSSYNSSYLIWTFASLRASRKMHSDLVHHIFYAPMRFLDQTPTGRLIARFAKDIGTIDGRFASLWQGFSELSVTLAMKFVLLVYLVPLFGPIGVVIAIVGFCVGELYVHGQLSVKREMSNAKSPLYSSFAAAINGIVSIRAYGAQGQFQHELQGRADKYTRCASTFYNLSRWVTIRIDVLGALFSASLGALLFYGGSKIVNAALVGFMLNQSTSFAEILLYFVRVINDVEVQGNSIERIADYLRIDQEPAATEKGKPPASWPTSGNITVSNLTARYFDGGPIVLDNVSLDVTAGSRVGIVGRTGSGKSSFTLALLRMMPTEGHIRISGLDSKSINLEALRSQITIIPQDPILLSGTLRSNLDPFEEHEDYELNDALRASGLDFSGGVAGTSGAVTPAALTLDTGISSGGSNLSQGQRQLVALARALVRRAKFLVLDEATASVDHTTDALVQQAIRKLHDVTILTIAHRLSTIMDYDKVMVLQAGKLVEYDTPANLLSKDSGYLRALVNDSDDREELERLANQGRG